MSEAQANKDAADAAVAKAQAEVDRINASIDAATEQAKQGSLGFVNWMLQKEGLSEKQLHDLTTAKETIEKAQVESFDGWAGGDNIDWLPEERNNMVTVIGDEKDATSLANLQKSIEVMERINELRATDNNFVGEMQRNASLTNFYLMAVAQTGADRAAGLLRHSSLKTSCENLAFGYVNDPTVGWYKKEKKVFDSIKNQLGITTIDNATLKQIRAKAKTQNKEIGHYVNLFYSTDQVMGVGFTQYQNTACYNASPMASYEKRSLGYTVEEFEAMLNEYLAFLNNPANGLGEAKAALDQSKSQQKAAGSELTAKQIAASSAANDVAAVKEARAKAADAVTASEQNIAGKKQTVSDAQTSVNQAQGELAQANEQVTAADEAVSAQQAALSRAKDALVQREAELAAAGNEVDAAETSRNAAQAELASLSADLATAQANYDAAVAAQQEAVDRQNAAADALSAAQAEANAADADLQQAKDDEALRQNAVAAAKASADAASKTLTDAQDESNRLNSLVENVKQAKTNSTEAETAAVTAQTEADEAAHAVAAAEATVAQQQQAADDANEFLQAAKSIDASSAYANGIADTRFSQLNQLYAKARNAQAAADAAKQELEAAKEETGRHSERYVTALLDYQEATENLRNVQAAYNAALAKEQAQREAAEAQAKQQNKTADSETVSQASYQQPSSKQTAATATAQAEFASPKTADSAATDTAAALAAAGVGATLLASSRKHRHAKNMR